MAIARKCAFCGGVIPPERGHKTLYCNDICKAKSKREQREARRAAAKEGRDLPLKRCVECGAQFKASTGGKIYCSDKCRAEHRKKELAERGPKTVRLCKTCGASLAGMFSSCRYCSPGCREKAKKNPDPARSCPVCGAKFTVKPHTRQKYCSPECRARASNEHLNAGARKNALADRECEWCGKVFKPSTNKNRFCSKACTDRKPSLKKKPGTNWAEIQRKCLGLHLSYGEAVQRGLLD